MIYKILHLSFQSDNLGRTSTLVEANSEKDALEIYNAEAKMKSEHPFMWNQATLKDVMIPYILRRGEI